MKEGQEFFICTTKDNPDNFPYIRKIYIDMIGEHAHEICYFNCSETNEFVNAHFTEDLNHFGVMPTEEGAIERYKERVLEIMSIAQNKLEECEEILKYL